MLLERLKDLGFDESYDTDVPGQCSCMELLDFIFQDFAVATGLEGWELHKAFVDFQLYQSDAVTLNEHIESFMRQYTGIDEKGFL